jgi:toxin CcdB
VAQFDIYRNSDERTRVHTPYLLDAQADLLSELATRVVVPLRPGTAEEPWAISRLHTVITVGEEPHLAVVSELAAVPVTILGSRVGNARSYRTELLAAIDLLITGF